MWKEGLNQFSVYTFILSVLYYLISALAERVLWYRSICFEVVHFWIKIFIVHLDWWAALDCDNFIDSFAPLIGPLSTSVFKRSAAKLLRDWFAAPHILIRRNSKRERLDIAFFVSQHLWLPPLCWESSSEECDSVTAMPSSCWETGLLLLVNFSSRNSERTTWYYICASYC